MFAMSLYLSLTSEAIPICLTNITAQVLNKFGTNEHAKLSGKDHEVLITLKEIQETQ